MKEPNSLAEGLVLDGLNLVATEVFAANSTMEEAPRDRLRRVFVGCGDALHRFVFVRIGGNREAAEDMVQQVCCEAAKHRRMPADDAQCQAWLFGIARNLVRKHWQSRRRDGARMPRRNAEVSEALAQAMEASPMPLDSLTRVESATQLMLAITTLSAMEQGLVFDIYFGGRSRAEIAQDLGLTVKAVEARLYRIRHRLRKELRGEMKGNHNESTDE